MIYEKNNDWSNKYHGVGGEVLSYNHSYTNLFLYEFC